MKMIRNITVIVLAVLGLLSPALSSRASASTAEWMRLNVQLINETELIERLWFIEDPVVMNNVLCLAANIYHEARGSTTEDQYAVAHVVMNRVKSRNWAKNPCQVIWEPYQFSWTNDGNSDIPMEPIAWRKAQEIAWNVYSKQSKDVTGGADHYHHHTIQPRWSKEVQFRKKIGAHLYMKL